MIPFSPASNPMKQLGVPRGQCFAVGSDQATINRLADIVETCSVDMPEAFSCAVCLELMVCPISCFPCRHSFCEPCLRLITHAGDPLDILCPICRQAILCCGPNNVLKRQMFHVDPLVASAYERRLDWFSRQEDFREMRLPGVAGLGILPKIGAWLPRGNLLADYLVRTLFGLITGRGVLDICRQLFLRYQQLFAFTFSVLIFLLIPCVYLRTILQHPLPPSISPPNNAASFSHALFNMSDISNTSSSYVRNNNYATPTLPFTPYGRLSVFPLLALCSILFLCGCRMLACSRPPEEFWVDALARYSRTCVAITAAYYLALFSLFACFCRLVDLHLAELFNSFSYWEENNRAVARLQFAVCSFVCAAYWTAMLLAAAACFKLDTSRHIGSWKCFKVLVIAFVVYYAAMWLVFITLDYYFNFMYR